MRKSSRKWRALDLMRVATGGAATASVLTMLASNISAAKVYVDTVRDFVSTYGWAWTIGLCWALFLLAELVQRYVLQDYEQGRYRPSGDEERQQ